MKSGKGEVTPHRVEPSLPGKAEAREVASLQDRPALEPVRTGMWFAVASGIVMLLGVAAAGVYWTGHRMPAPTQAQTIQAAAAAPAEPSPAPPEAKSTPAAAPATPPPAPAPAAKSPEPTAAADPPRLIGPAAPKPAEAPGSSPHLVEGAAPLLAPVAPWEQEVVISPPPARAREQAPLPISPPPPRPRKVQVHRAPGADAPAAGSPSGIRF